MGSARAQGELWGRGASDWSTLQEAHHRPLFVAMLDAARVGSGTRLLDAGCGTGGACVLAAERGAIVTGLDASAPMIEIAQARLPDSDFRVGDLESLPFPDATFGAALAASSIQFAGEPGTALRELRRVVPPDGRVVVSLFADPATVDLRVVYEAVRNVLGTRPSPGDPFALSRDDDLEELMLGSGLTPMATEETDCELSFPDRATAWRAIASSGPLQSAIDSIGEADLRSAVLDVLGPFETRSGGFRLRNRFKSVLAHPG